MDQDKIYIGIAVLISFTYFFIFLKNFKGILSIHSKWTRFISLSILNASYTWLLFFFFLKSYQLVSFEQYFSTLGLLSLVFLFILFHLCAVYLYNITAKETITNHFFTCVIVSIGIIVCFTFNIKLLNRNVTFDKSELALAGIILIISLFLSTRLMKLIYNDLIKNEKTISTGFLALSAFMISHAFIGSCLEVIGSISIINENHSSIIEIISILILLLITASYSEKQYIEKNQELFTSNNHLNFLAYHDTLTELPNRRKVIEVMNEWIEKNTKFAVFFIDLDHFKHVNDLLGHEVGDKLLVHISKQLNLTISKSDIVGRLGGDEFIILKAFNLNDELTQFSSELIAKVTNPVIIEGHTLNVTTSIGVACFPENGLTVKQLMKKADIAMYCSKDQGRNTFFFYTSEIDHNIVRKIKLKEDLKYALARQELEIHYQPKYVAKTQEVIGFEALLRWYHPSIGYISPLEFIPIAEETGSIIEIGNWVLENSCQDIYELNKESSNNYSISVNVSIKQMAQTNFVETVKSALSKTNIPPSKLELEITESMAMEDISKTSNVFLRLRELGIQISIDDFGTGYSSFSYLKELHIQKLKIDKSFIQELEINNQNKPIVSAIISMARDLGLKITAEGVETSDQLTLLQTMDCDEVQGFYLSKPQPLQSIKETLNKQLSIQK
ncbi:bifunctional diguanylate cyclase/phosphodiesterase [Bacillus timonensis]|nr:bifunctional diguanylate cyclase/phosphodiesterase [Bacillus timonensis]